MKNAQKQLKKSILNDPLTAYRQQGITEDQKQLDSLQQYWEIYQDCKSSLKKNQIATRTISRQIGQAKKNQDSVDGLMAQMQAQTAEMKSLSETLQRVEVQILEFFPTANQTSDSENSGTPGHTQPDMKVHTYPDSQHSDYSISLLENGPDAEGEEKAWNDYVNTNPSASVYHRIEWKHLIQNTFSHKGYYFQARDNHTHSLIGVLPLIRLNSRLFGDFLVSMPYFNYGGAVANNPEIELALIEAANRLAVALGVSHCEYREDISRKDTPTRSEKVNMILALPKQEKQLWGGFSAKLRAQIRRPERENPEVKFGGIELLSDFYEVFARNMRDLGTPVYSRSFFKNILETFPDISRLCILRLPKQPVAAGFLIGHNETLEIPWASTVKEVNHLSMNMLMYWEILKFAIRNNYNYFDFGRSSKESGTFRFKQQWGAIPKPMFWNYWLADNNNMPSLNPNNPKFKLIIAAWKRLPVPVTKLLGPAIVKNLP